MKYIVIPILLISSTIAAQEDKKGTIKVAKQYNDIVITLAYTDSNGVPQILAMDDIHHVISAKNAHAATMLYIFATEGENQIPVSLASYRVTIAKKRTPLREFTVVGNEFDTAVLNHMSKLTPGDVVYFDEIYTTNPKRRIASRVFRIIE